MFLNDFHRRDEESGHKSPQKLKRVCTVAISVFVFTLVVLAIPSIWYKFSGVFLTLPISTTELPLNWTVKGTKFPLDSNGFLSTLDTSTEPCEDFYQFACGSWHGNSSFAAAVDEQFHDTIIEMLLEPIDENDISGYNHAKMYFRKCLEFPLDLYDTVPSYVRNETNRTIECLAYVELFYKLPLGHVYLTNLYGDNTLNFIKMLAEAETISRNVQESCNRTMQELNFNFNCSKVEVCLGFPSWILNRTRVEEEHNPHLVSHDTTWKYLLIQTIPWIFEDVEFRAARDNYKCLWGEFQGGVGGMNIASDRIFIKMGFMQPPYFTLNRSLAFNYGLFGFVIGHELSHSVFTAIDRNLEREAWLNMWTRTKKSSTFGTKLKQCLKTQFGNFSVKDDSNKDLFVNGEQTLEENFADHVGLQAAFKAYKLANSRSKDVLFSGDYSDDQQFFLGFAQMHCDSYNIEKTIRDDVHSPGRFRVLGALQNSEEFAKAWNCPVGSKMNPDPSVHTKCVLD